MNNFTKRLVLFYIVICIASLMVVSCAHLSDTIVKKGSWSIEGGKFDDKKWNDILSFRRVSWFQELTLVYDVFVADYRQDSNFNNWFSSFEKKQIEKCENFFIVVNYSQDSSKISHELFYQQMKQQGLEKIMIGGFFENFKMHSSYSAMSLKQYEVHGFCGLNNNGISIVFPGFNRVDVIN